MYQVKESIKIDFFCICPSEVKALEAPSIFHTILSSPSISDNETKNLPSHTNKRSYSDENSEYNYKIDEQLSPSKRSRSSQDTNDIIRSKILRIFKTKIIQ